MPIRDVTLSVVSHGHNGLLNELLRDLERHCTERVSLVLTENVPDTETLDTKPCSFPVRLIVNGRRKGFGANHNSAFTTCATPYFCVANPDIRLHADPFPGLIETMSQFHAGVTGPLVRNPQGEIEDSARRFPTMRFLGKKLLRRTITLDYSPLAGPTRVDWVAGMFMLFRADAYRAVGGFDERYFMYYEDVDLCRRLGRAGVPVIYDPKVEVVHDARRESRRNVRLAAHHVTSIVRFLMRG